MSEKILAKLSVTQKKKRTDEHWRELKANKLNAVIYHWYTCDHDLEIGDVFNK